MNEHQTVNKEYKAPQRITWNNFWSRPPINSFPLK